LRRLLANRKGNVAILFALALVPVIGAMGAAVDYSLANEQRVNLQRALDATGLMLARIMPTTQSELDSKGQAFFNANLGTLPKQIKDVTLTITPLGTGKMLVAANATYHPELVNVLGVTSFPMAARTEVTWGFGKVEVALALDNTGSMSGNKIAQLKIAAHSLLDTLQAAAKNVGDAKVSIVPFGKQVKLSTSFRNENWLKWDSNSEKNNWTGCVEDRDKNNDVTDVLPTSNSTRFPGEPSSGCGSLATILPLSYDWSALHAKVDNMIATGNTNVPIGLVWAWHTLSSTLPFTEGTAYGTPNLTKFIILLTDGDNTENRWGDSTSTMNQRTTMVCNNVKAMGILIYTIRVINGNANLLRNCATTPSMFYDVDDASELNAVFTTIGAQIANLHLSK
jgi:Flp pilus assembly protein TadG